MLICCVWHWLVLARLSTFPLPQDSLVAIKYVHMLRVEPAGPGKAVYTPSGTEGGLHSLRHWGWSTLPQTLRVVYTPSGTEGGLHSLRHWGQFTLPQALRAVYTPSGTEGRLHSLHCLQVSPNRSPIDFIINNCISLHNFNIQDTHLSMHHAYSYWTDICRETEV